MQLVLLFYVPFTYTILREAAKAVGVWDFAPYLEVISSDMKFRETVLQHNVHLDPSCNKSCNFIGQN